MSGSAIDTVHILWTTFSEVRAVRVHCPTCRPFRVAAVAAFQEWYGWMVTCLRCGESWQDGEMLMRPCEPGWRPKAIQAARTRYRRVHPKGL